MVRGKAPAEVVSDIFQGFKNHQFLSTAHYSPVISTSNFNDFAFVLGMTVWYGDGAGNTIEEKSSVFSLIRMH